MERTGVGLAACDADGRLTLLSPVLQELFGVSFAPVTEVESPVLLPPDGRGRLHDRCPAGRRRWGAPAAASTCATSCSPPVAPAGGCSTCAATRRRSRTTYGEPQGAVVLVQDVTASARPSCEREAVQARVVETINHEFRTPLAALIGHLELIRDRADVLPEELAMSLDAIERAGWRLRDLVDAATELVEVGVTAASQVGDPQAATASSRRPLGGPRHRTHAAAQRGDQRDQRAQRDEDAHGGRAAEEREQRRRPARAPAASSTSPGTGPSTAPARPAPAG